MKTLPGHNITSYINRTLVESVQLNCLLKSTIFVMQKADVAPKNWIALMPSDVVKYSTYQYQSGNFNFNHRKPFIINCSCVIPIIRLYVRAHTASAHKRLFQAVSLKLIVKCSHRVDGISFLQSVLLNVSHRPSRTGLQY